MKQKLQDKLCQALLANGWREQAPTHRYRVFIKGDARLYAGRAGALRSGPTIKASIPADGLKKKLLADAVPLLSARFF